MFVPKFDTRSDLEQPRRNSGRWQCSICAQGNDPSYYSCELCGVLRDLSLYFNNASEVEAGAKRRNKYSQVSILARSLFAPSSTKSKAVVFSDSFQANRNATGNKQATMDALHKTYMTRKERHINIAPFKFDTPSFDDMVTAGLKSSRNFRKVDTGALSKDIVDVTGKKMVDDDILLTEKDTSMDPSSLAKLDELGRTSSNVPSNGQNKTFALDHELQYLSLERKPKNSKPKIKKPISISQYKPEPWMLHSEDQEMRRQLNLAIGKGSFAYAWAMDESTDERARGITMTGCSVL